MLAGYKRAQARLDAPKGSSQDVALVFVPEGSPGGEEQGSLGARKAVVITGGALGGAGVVMGAVFAVLANAKASDAATKDAALVKIGASASCGGTLSANCQALLTALRDQATLGNAAAWSFIGAGVVGAGTVVYALVAPRAVKASAMRVAPLVAADGGGIVVRGTW